MTVLITITFIATFVFWAKDAWELTKKEYEEDKKKRNRRNMNIDIKWTKERDYLWTKRTLSLFFLSLHAKHGILWRNPNYILKERFLC